MSDKPAKTAGCTNCAKMEQKYKENPRGFFIRIWKWHSGWCPGHKAYRKTVEAETAGH